MAKLNKERRDALPDSAFAIPEKRAYPVQDKGHAQAAVGEVAAHGSPEEKARVRATVKRRFGMAVAKKKGSR
jgi:hypothetical protein